MLRVTEIFTGIQGESSTAGFPFQFIRLTGCNLRCTYCDTKYAYEGGEEWAKVKIIEKVQKSPINRVLITGGEPLFQKETPELAKGLIDAGYDVFVETNGSLDISVLGKQVQKVMDVKCPGSGESHQVRFENISSLTEKDDVKFVLTDRRDFEWAVEILNKYNLDKKCNIFFSPIFGILKPATLSSWILDSDIPVRLNLQLHKIIWPEKTRGV